MTQGKWVPARLGRGVQGSLLRPEPPWFKKDDPVPTIWYELSVFFRYEIPAGLSKKDNRWALLALYAGALATAFKEAYALSMVLAWSLLIMAAWISLVLAVMIHVVVFHGSFLRRCMLDQPLPMVASHAIALCFSLPVFAASGLVQAPIF